VEKEEVRGTKEGYTEGRRKRYIRRKLEHEKKEGKKE